MSTATATHTGINAIDRAANVAPSSTDIPPSTRNLTIEQETLVRAFGEAYAIDRNNISFDGNKPEPIFHFDALMQLALTLADFKELSVTPGDINVTHGIATAEGMVRLPDERVIRMFGSCLVGDTFHDGTSVTDISNALEVARARALRSVLRGIGFDPVRAHNEQKSDFAVVVKDVDQMRVKDLKEIHALADEVGLISDGDDSRYRHLISIYFPGMSSAASMDAQQRAQLIAVLRGIKNSRENNASH